MWGFIPAVYIWERWAGEQEVPAPVRRVLGGSIRVVESRAVLFRRLVAWDQGGFLILNHCVAASGGLPAGEDKDWRSCCPGNV